MNIRIFFFTLPVVPTTIQVMRIPSNTGVTCRAYHSSCDTLASVQHCYKLAGRYKDPFYVLGEGKKGPTCLQNASLLVHGLGWSARRQQAADGHKKHAARLVTIRSPRESRYDAKVQNLQRSGHGSGLE